MITLADLNDICFLVTEGKMSIDDDGFQTETDPVKEEIWCGVKSATRSEYYSALKNDIHIALVFKIGFYDYDNQKRLEYRGTMYNIERVYRTSEDYIELSCSEVGD